MKYFSNVKTLDELKRAYRLLCMKHHPDVGGDTATMQAINAEHDWSSTKKLWYWHHAEDGHRWHRGKSSMSQIRAKYGSQTYRSSGAIRLDEATA